MVPSPCDNLAISHDLNPLGNDVLAIVGGHLDVHSFTVTLVFGGHFDVSISVSDVADLGFSGVNCPIELIDAAVSFGQSLVGDCSLLAYH